MFNHERHGKKQPKPQITQITQIKQIKNGHKCGGKLRTLFLDSFGL